MLKEVTQRSEEVAEAMPSENGVTTFTSTRARAERELPDGGGLRCTGEES